MKVNVTVEIPDKESCLECGYRVRGCSAFVCGLFKQNLKAGSTPCSICKIKRKETTRREC